MNEAAKGENSGITPTTLKTPLAAIDREKFTAKGFEELSKCVNSYIEDLAEESSKISGRYRADLISAFHVEKAAEHLASGSALDTVRHAGTVGGLLLGGGLSEVLSMLSTKTITVVGLITSCMCFAVGAYALALQRTRD